jgi:branched-chain amino acid aminotransferase
MNSRFAWINGEMVETSQATIPLLTSGFHYGIGIFEGIRAYKAPEDVAVFRLREHMLRFEQSAKILGFKSLGYSLDELIDAVLATVRKNAYGDCYVRPIAWLGDGGWNLTTDSGKVHVAVAVWEQSVYVGKVSPEDGVRACISSFVRHHPNAMMTKAKTNGNYVNSFMAKTEAHRRGFDEALMLDHNGYVTEATGANLFVVRGNTLVTPEPDAILEGITRRTVFDLAKDLGLEVREGRLTRDHLYVCDELFVCGTAAEVIGVRDVDGRPVGAGKTGPVTLKIREAYLQAVRGAHPRSKGWLTS